ncbi:MAG: gliding motility-associated ABC transporter substrate-binding protein GldG [Bacteroidetes bacterium]|nr:gliding motility-associated ABC transporter substrate-binding protein GldG [Bacteroidota bacterium]
MEKVNESKKNIKKNNIVQLLLVLVVVILLNIISAYIFTRFDLTSEKRYSLAPATKKVVKKLDDVMFFRVYLSGDLPPAFQRLANETREMLDEFRAYSDFVQYQFVDLSAISNEKDRDFAYKSLAEKGLQRTTLRMNNKGQSSQLIIFPGAIVTYRGHETPVQLLSGSSMGEDPNKVLNNSIQSLEYNLASAMEVLTKITKPRIAILEGQGELSAMETYDLERSLTQFYNVDRVTLNHKINALTIRVKLDSLHDRLANKYKALIIAKPSKPFDEKDKFLIDQFIMRGGKTLWLIDPVYTPWDSLEKYNSTMGVANDINLEDMLYTYGARLNTNLVMDLNAMPIPLKTGQIGNQPQFTFFRWYYFPLLTPTINHPIVHGLNAIKSEFISTIDTVEAPGIKKQIILTSSSYSQVVNVPALVDLEMLRQQPDERQFTRGPFPVAVLLEGEFMSSYLYRIPPELAENKGLEFRKKSKPTKMLIVADGDIVKNQFNMKQGYPLPMGYDQWTQETFGNRDFILNAMNFLCDETGLITVRSRELKMRLLDMKKVENEGLFWKLLNIILPVLLILAFSFIWFRIRRMKYARKSV